MAKVSKKKSSKKSKKSSKSTAAAVKADVVYDDEDEAMSADEASEEEEEEEDERKHQKLLEAISALGGKRRKKLGERSEAAVQMCEFTVSADGQGDKIQLSDLIGTMEENTSVPSKTKKQLKNLQHSSSTLDSPVPQQHSSRIQRDVAFQKAAVEVSRWAPVIRQHQQAEQMHFPLARDKSGPKAMERVVTGWKSQTPLEQEVFALLTANQQPIHDPVLTPAEEASVLAMSLDQAKVRRAELQKARALQSYYEAKSRRTGKIKSKKFHRVQNKAKRKEFLKQFDELVKTDPAKALEQLGNIELARMKERMSLKHQNSGKWAKTKAIMAKYDEGARKAMQQQLEVNKELTQKMVTSLNPEEEEEQEEEEDLLPECVNDAEPALDASNPWMSGKLSEEKMSETVDLTADQPEHLEHGGEEEEEEEEEEVLETEEEALLRGFDRRRKERQEQDCVPGVEDELEHFKSMYKEVADGLQRAEAAADTSAPLDHSVTRVRTVEDVDLLSQDKEEEVVEEEEEVVPVEPQSTETKPPASQHTDRKRKKKRGIELKEVLRKEAQVIQVPLALTVEDTEHSEEPLDQRGLIREAFAGDDVVADFLKDKKKQEDQGKPKVVDLTLPGWGEWGGTGLKPSRKKRRRFRVKPAPAPPRKDQRLPSVIISEKRDSSLSSHQVNSLPFPFDNRTQFENTIRSPLGRTWNTERTVHKLSKPKVVTQMGAIIEPMAKDRLVAGSKATVDSGKKRKL